MDELNINNLPPEMLTEVFRNLNKRNLNTVTMVCKLWKNLIESAFRWSLGLAYDDHGKLLSKDKNYILTTNRKFGTIKVFGSRFNEDEQKVEIFKRHGFNVVELHLHLYGCRMNIPTGFAELLSFTPNLKHAIVGIQWPSDNLTGFAELLNDTSHDSSDELLMDELLPDLKKFKSLEIYGHDLRILKCFRKAKLTTMELHVALTPENHSLLVDFLLTQDKLTSLIVASISSSILIEMGKVNVPIPFRLRQLSISDIDCQKPSQDHDYLMRFIESQAGNLTAIEMKNEIPRSVYECVFTNMTKLTTLSVKTDDFPWDIDFYDRLKENGSVHTLRLRNRFSMFDIHLFGKFLQKLPNVRCLFLSDTELLVMAQSLSKLESLYIERFYGTSLDGVKFPNLKTLHIEHLGGEINWNEFTKAHPLLTELNIDHIQRDTPKLTSDDIEQMTNNVDLQQIRLGTGFVADNRFFEVVGSKCANLKVLDLDKSCVSQNLGHYLRIDVLRLRDSIQYPKLFRSRFLS